MPRGGQSVRHWRLLQFLGRSQGLAVEEAAQELPIYDERDGRRGVWRIEQGFKDRLPIPLSLSEAFALLVCQDLLNPAGAGPLGPSVASVFAKVRALLTPRALELVDRMRQAVGARALGAKLQLGTAERLPAIQSAVAAGLALQIRYYSMSRDAETERRVDPYHLVYFNSGLYLVGYCHLRQEVRTFAVERIRALEPLEAAFTMPAAFDLEAPRRQRDHVGLGGYRLEAAA